MILAAYGTGLGVTECRRGDTKDWELESFCAHTVRCHVATYEEQDIGVHRMIVTR